ncbi:MAG: hypothetical protein CML68_20295 [Rhodobacteraceae bacterium]|nr:hypothetical protein [Paracoccaceae bacterium]
MAETGLPRDAARLQAEALLGSEAGPLRLPDSERDVIDLALATVGKWRVAVGWTGQIRPLGFDLAQVDVAARWLGITPDPELLDGMGMIERAALKVMNAK